MTGMVTTRARARNGTEMYFDGAPRVTTAHNGNERTL